MPLPLAEEGYRKRYAVSRCDVDQIRLVENGRVPMTVMGQFCCQSAFAHGGRGAPVPLVRKIDDGLEIGFAAVQRQFIRYDLDACLARLHANEVFSLVDTSGSQVSRNLGIGTNWHRHARPGGRLSCPPESPC